MVEEAVKETREERRKRYQKEWRASNPDKVQKYWRDRTKDRDDFNRRRREYYRLNREKVIAHIAERGRKRKQKAIDLLGGACVMCGTTDRVVLQIDHVNGGGTADRERAKTTYQYYGKIIKEHDTGKYQLLCANCHLRKHATESCSG